jgi:hypothetical protein
METKEVARRAGVKPCYTTRWAAHNGVAFSGEGRHRTYLWTDADVQRFLERDTKRGPKPH